MVGANRFSRRRNKDKTIVLMYHGVVPNVCPLAEGNWLQVREADFYLQLRHLSRYYDVVHLSQINQPHTGKKPRAVITFDDGYANNYHVAFPLLKAFGLPATMFLVTSYIDTDHIFWYDRLWCALKDHETPREIEAITDGLKSADPSRIDEIVRQGITHEKRLNAVTEYPLEQLLSTYGILTREQIQEMRKSGLVEFGSHTHRHDILTHLPHQEVCSTLSDARHRGLWYLGIDFTSFCPPNGDYLPEHFELYRRFGIERAVTTKPGFYKAGTNLFEIPRMGIGRGLSLAEFEVTILGLHHKIKE
jgi:peptidoglycan/xylan/chitin deacetylase (PgdA/CDA1 family)